MMDYRCMGLLFVFCFLTAFNIVSCSNEKYEPDYEPSRTPVSLDNLGSYINAQVRESLRPLDGLNERINAEVERSLAPLRGNQIPYVYNRGGFDNGPRYNGRDGSYNPNSGGSWPLGGSLDHLGEDIQQSVEQSLQPVRAMEMMFKVRDGVGGVTVVTYKPKGETFIMKDRVMYKCSGEIKDGECSGDLTKYEPTGNEGYCYLRSILQVNDKVCLSYGSVSFSVHNGEAECKSSNSEAILMTIDQYNKMCADIATEATYTYYANSKNPDHVQIPNTNPHFLCKTEADGVCTFSESLKKSKTYSGSVIYSSGGGVQMYSTGNGNFHTDRHNNIQILNTPI